MTSTLTSFPMLKKLVEKGRILFSGKYLLVTNTVVSVSFSVAGDAVIQSGEMYQNPSQKWDLKRSAHVGSTGLVIGPFCHYWYIFLDWYLPGKTARTVAKKVVLDQFICSPVVIGSFFWMTCAFENKSKEETVAELKDKGPSIYLLEWLIWPPAQIINFSILPTRFRLLYDSFISLGFDCYFSKVKYSKKQS